MADDPQHKTTAAPIRAALEAAAQALGGADSGLSKSDLPVRWDRYCAAAAIAAFLRALPPEADEWFLSYLAAAVEEAARDA